MKRRRRIGGIVLLLYILMATMLYFLQEKLIFLPNKLPRDFTYSFVQDFKEINLKTEDGAVLNALHFKSVDPKGLILYFHGNAGDLSRWGTVTSSFVEKNYDVVVMDYRTYGKSMGKLSEEALHNDAQLFYEYALEQYGADQITLYGRSLGTGIAIKLAANNKPKRLVLETPYYSLIEIAKKRFPLLPVEWLLKYRFPSFEYVQDVSCPITIFHGTEDRVVPFASGKRLFNAIPITAKSFYAIEGGAHNNLAEFGGYQRAIDEVLQ